jgi:hypothetical protein
MLLFFANYQLHLTELLTQPGILHGKTTDPTGAAKIIGALQSPGDILGVPGELPEQFGKLGGVDPLPTQDPIDLATSSPSLIHLRKDRKLFRITDGQPHRPDQNLRIAFDDILIAFGNFSSPLKPINHR